MTGGFDFLFFAISSLYIQALHQGVFSSWGVRPPPPVYGAALEDLIKHEFKIKSKSEVFAQIQEQDTHMGMAVYFGKCTAKAKYTTNPS